MVVAPGAVAYRTLCQRARRRRVGEVALGGRWLVLAPHPDDETLGPGGLLAALAAAGERPLVAFLTDGSGSHVGAPGWSGARVAAVRRQEAAAALRVLGVTAPALHLGWPDAAPVAPDAPAFHRSTAALVAFCRHHGVRQVAVTWDGEPHCDHEAAALLAVAASRRGRMRLYRYLVWGWTDAGLVGKLAGARGVTIDTRGQRPRQRRAIACHRTQRGGRITEGERFTLPKAMLRLVDRPHTLLLEMRDAA